MIQEDKLLLEIYMIGFNDYLSQRKKKTYQNKLHQAAYNCGQDDAWVGDDCPSNDYRSSEQILEEIKGIAENGL